MANQTKFRPVGPGVPDPIVRVIIWWIEEQNSAFQEGVDNVFPTMESLLDRSIAGEDLGDLASPARKIQNGIERMIATLRALDSELEKAKRKDPLQIDLTEQIKS
jgi:hypothetical protein